MIVVTVAREVIATVENVIHVVTYSIMTVTQVYCTVGLFK